MDLVTSIWLAVLAFGAAIVNGAVGYGFSSIVTPIAILWIPNKVLNPALVTVELLVNTTLLVRERRYIAGTWAHARPVVLTLLPGVILGTLGLAVLAVLTVKFVVYAALLPLILVQLVGFSRPVKNYRAGGMAVGPAIGFLYALTTISGPPLALFFRNQGLAKSEFRATIAQVRVAESSLTLGVYSIFTFAFGAGLVTLPALSLLPSLLIPVVFGIPIGAFLLSRVSADSFRRFVMNVDGLIVSYGLSQVFFAFGWTTKAGSYGLLLLLAAVVIGLSAAVVARARRTVARPAPFTASRSAGPPSAPAAPDPGSSPGPPDPGPDAPPPVGP